MPKRYVLLQYDEDEARTHAFKLKDGALRRSFVAPTERIVQVVRGPSAVPSSIWSQSQDVPTEGLEYLRLVAIRSALQILDEGEVSQARVQVEIDKLVPEASEDPEACDRDCGLSEDDPRRFDPDEVGHP